MNKQSLISILLTMLMSMFGAKAFAYDIAGYDIAVKNADGVTIYYKWANDAKTELAVSYRGSDKYFLSYSSEYTGNVVIPENVEYNGNTYPVTSIRGHAFVSCSGLTSVTIPNSVTSIGIYAFSGCSGLTSVTIPNSVTSIGSSAFSSCSGLTSVTIPNSVTFIGESAFSYCRGLTSVTIPNSVTSIGGSAFNNCSGLTSVSVLCSPTTVGHGVFLYCPNLKEVTFDCETVTKIFSENTAIEKVTLKECVTSIGEYAFYGCSGLTSVTIPNSVTSIGDYAFCSIGVLASVIIGSGVISIASNAFSYTNLKKTIWLTNTPPSGYNNAKGAVNFVSNDQFNIDNKVVYKYLSSNFVVDGIRYVPVSPSDRTCDAIDCIYDESAENINIGETVTNKSVTLTVMKVNPFTCYGNKHIKDVKLSAVTTIEDYTFSGCSSLTEMVIGSKVTTINQGAFSGCSALPSITIPQAVTTIGNNVFENCTSLAKVTIADSETTLTLGSNGSNATFSSCPLDYVYIGRDISYQTSSKYGYSPFYRNTTLREVKITDKETEISENEFYGCTNLQTVTIGDGVTAIGNWAFSGCQSLKFFTFGSEVKTIGQEAFSDCTAVTEIFSRAVTPPICGSQALDDINKWDCKLYVPEGCLIAYQAADQWKEFFFAEEIPEKVDVTIGGAGYTTYTSPYNLDFSGFGDDVKAYIATGYDYDNGTIWLTRVKDVPAGTALMVKGTASKTYNIPVKTSSGCYYKNMLVGNLSGGTITIGGTTDGMTDYYLKNGSFLSADGTNTINNGKAYLQIPTTPPAANVGSSQAVKLNDYGFASLCGSQDLDFTDVEGLKAFAVTGYDDANGTIWLTRVKRVSAQTPLLLKGESKGSYSVPSVAVGSYYANMMKGNLSGETITIFTTDGDMTNYYLKGNQLLKATDKGNTIGNGKAYMQIPSKHVTRSMEDMIADLLIYGISDDEPEMISIPVARGINGDGTTGIHTIENGESENGVYYNLQGQRVENPTKGLYIKNGRKVVIK